MSELKGKVVIVTGASGGIGAGTAVEFARQGARLVLTGRHADRLQQTAEQCRAEGLPADQVVCVIADSRKESDLDKIVEAAIQNFGTVDVLVNNAGMPMNGLLEEATVENYDVVIDVNVRSPFLLTQKAAPYIIANKGHIINVSSVAGLRAEPNLTLYCVTKRAMDMFTKALALELGPQGVHVNSVNPGCVEDTVIWTKEGSGWDMDKLPIFYERIKKNSQLGRLCQVKDVAKAIVFLTSERSSFVTGYNLPIDGGLRNVTARKPPPPKNAPPPALGK